MRKATPRPTWTVHVTSLNVFSLSDASGVQFVTAFRVQ